jgi:hypothetical protein
MRPDAIHAIDKRKIRQKTLCAAIAIRARYAICAMRACVPRREAMSRSRCAINHHEHASVRSEAARSECGGY